ncbi:hypothetical protein Tco_0782961 [Tanacetum coccineum]
MILLLRSVTVPPVTGNFNISWAVDGITLILLTPGLPIIPLYGECDLTIMKFIHAEVECSSYPIFTSSDTCPIGHIISPLNPTKISEEASPFTYMRWTRCPPTSASITMGPSVPSSSPKGGNEIIVFGENVWVILCLAIFHPDCTIRIASGLSFPVASPFFATFAWCMHSSVVCLTSSWNSQNLLAFLFSTGVVIGGGGLNFPLSRASISFGVYDLAASMAEMSSSVPGCQLPLLL